MKLWELETRGEDACPPGPYSTSSFMLGYVAGYKKRDGDTKNLLSLLQQAVGIIEGAAVKSDPRPFLKEAEEECRKQSLLMVES